MRKQKTQNYHVASAAEAWEKVDGIFDHDYEYSIEHSKRAGYPVYMSTDCISYYGWIDDLQERLEINLPTGRTVNVWIDTEPTTDTADTDTDAQAEAAQKKAEENTMKNQKTMVITKARKIYALAKIGDIIDVDGNYVKVVASKARKTEPTTEQAETQAEKDLKKAKSDLQAAEKRAARAETKAAEAEKRATQAELVKAAKNPARKVAKAEAAEAEAVKTTEQAAEIIFFNGIEQSKADAEQAAKRKAEAAEAAEAEAREKDARAAARVGMPEITIHGNGYIRDGKLADMTEYVKFYIASDIVRKCRNTCAGYKNQLAEIHPRADFMRCSDDVLLKYAKEFSTNNGKGRAFTAAEAGKVLDDRRALVYAEAQLAEQTKTESDWRALSYGAKNAVRLYAIRNYRGATLDKSTLETGQKDEKGKPLYIDFSAPVKKAYQYNGNYNALANTVRGLIYKVFPANELTFGVSCSLEQLLTSSGGFDIHSLAAAFGGSAKQDKNGNFLFFLDTSYPVVLKAFLVFVSVIVETGNFKARDFKAEAETQAACK